jgi:hypothetical protein
LILALPRPLLEDQALFSELDSVLAEIRRCYMELDKFWTEEISRAIEALKMRRVDPADFERWKNFRSNLKHTIESWKVQYCFLFLCCALPTDQNALFRMSRRVVLKLYVATMHLRFAHSRFHFGDLRLTVRRKVTSER